MCPMTAGAGLFGLLAAFPLFGWLLPRMPRMPRVPWLASLRSRASTPDATTGTQQPDTGGHVDELVRARREITELHAQLAWQTRLAQNDAEGTAPPAREPAREPVGAR